LIALALVLLQPRWVMQDQRPLLTLNAEPFDAVGGANEIWGRLRSRCGAIESVDKNSESGRAVVALLQRYSPPDSLSARVIRIDSLSQWLLVEAVFDALPPVLVLMRGTNEATGLPVIEAVWSGTSYPWRIVPFATEFLMQRAPEVPPALLRCARPGFR